MSIIDTVKGEKRRMCRATIKGVEITQADIEILRHQLRPMQQGADEFRSYGVPLSVSTLGKI